MMDSGEVFARRVMDSSMADTPENGARWLTVGKGSYLILRAFDATDSDTITECLTQRPGDFIFTDMGNVSCTDRMDEVHYFENPSDPSSNRDYTTRSLVEIQQNVSHQYVWDDRNVISRNLRYILHRTDRWYLLYNSLHTTPFGDYYRRVVAEAPGMSWGATVRNTASYINLNRVFNNYCDAFTVRHTSGRFRGKRSYLDPSCNMLKSEQQAQRTAVFDTALVCPQTSTSSENCEYDDTTLQSAAPLLTQMGMGDPKYCLCMGEVNNFMDEVDSDDFMNVFEGRERCGEHNIEMNFCSIVNKAGNNLTIEGSEMVTSCGGNGGGGGNFGNGLDGPERDGGRDADERDGGRDADERDADERDADERDAPVVWSTEKKIMAVVGVATLLGWWTLRRNRARAKSTS